MATRLWSELELIRSRGVADIVSVDDVHTFGKVRNELRFQPGAIEWEGVTTQTLTDYFGDRVHDSLVIGDGFVIYKKPAVPKTS